MVKRVTARKMGGSVGPTLPKESVERFHIKAGDVLNDSGYDVDSNYGLQIIGIAFIALGVLGLLGALVQDVRISRRLSNAGYGRVEPTPLGQVMGILVLVVGILGAIVIFL